MAALYHQYICDHYNNPEIVFDGYKKSTTKNQEDIRRSLFSLNKITLCRAAFYRQLESIVEGRPAGDTPLVLGDFNVQVGSSWTGFEDVVGPHGRGDRSSDNGSRLLDFARGHSLRIAGTSAQTNIVGPGIRTTQRSLPVGDRPHPRGYPLAAPKELQSLP